MRIPGGGGLIPCEHHPCNLRPVARSPRPLPPPHLGHAPRSLSPHRGAAAVTIAQDSYAATAADCPRRRTGPRRKMGPSDWRRRGVGTTRTLPNKIEHASSGGGVGRHLLLHKSANRPTHQFCCEVTNFSVTVVQMCKSLTKKVIKTTLCTRPGHTQLPYKSHGYGGVSVSEFLSMDVQFS